MVYIKILKKKKTKKVGPAKVFKSIWTHGVMCHKNLKFLFLTTTEIKMPTDSKTKKFKISHFKTHIVNKILNTQLKFFRLGSCTWNSLPWLLPCPLGLNSNLSSSVLTTPCKVKSFPFLCFTL